MDITASSLRADAIHAIMLEKRRQKAQEQHEQEEKAKAEREKLYQAFLHDEVPKDALDRVARIVRRAAEMGEEQTLVFQFPSAWLPDRGRAIINAQSDWHRHLIGLAQRAYDYFERELKPRGFHLRAEILSWPDGMPGDVGVFLGWQR